MIPIYICDDEANMLQALSHEMEQAILAEDYDMELAGAYGAPGSLLTAVENDGRRGIYFLDVDLKSEAYNGFTLAAAIREIDPRGFLIFVTTHGELALETFRYRLEAMDYIEKDDPVKLAARLRVCLSEVTARLMAERREVQQVYSIQVMGGIRHIPVQEILYIETSSKQHNLVLHSDSQIIEYRGKLSEVEESLGEGFWRVHRSYLVNRLRVRQISLREDIVELENGEACPLSRKAKRDYKTV